MNFLRRLIWPSIPTVPYAEPPSIDVESESADESTDKNDDDNRFAIPPSVKLVDQQPPTDEFRRCLTVVLLPEFVSIVLAYAFDIQYTWNRQPYYESATVMDNIAVSRRSASRRQDRWIRIVAGETLADGPHRWRVLTEFDPPLEGWIAIGLSSDTVCRKLNGNSWPDVAVPTDFLVSTGMYRYEPSLNTARLFLGGGDFKTNLPRSAAPRNITLLEFDPAGPTLTVSFRGFPDDAVRTVVVSLPPVPVSAWRPAVTVCGAVRATILDW